MKIRTDVDGPASEARSTGRLPLSVKLLYGSGGVAPGVKNAVFDTFLLYYETNVLGLSGALAGLSVFIAMCVDAVSDPLVGALSDHFRSRWGRRHPFMYAAALPMPLALYGLLTPPAGLDTAGLFAWLTTMSVLVRLFLTLHHVPSDALGPELTSSYDERTSLVGVRYLFTWGGMLGLALLGWLVVFPLFPDGRNQRAAYAPLAAAGAVLAFASIVACAVGTHHLIPTLRRPDAQPGRTRFLRDVRGVLANESYRMVLLATICGAIALGFNEALGLYMTTYFWELGDGDQAKLLGVVALAMPVAFWLARRTSLAWDKRRAALGLMAFVIPASGLPIYARLLGWLPDNGTAALLAILAVHAAAVLTAVVALVILLASMIQDAVDENELETGRRTEGLFVSVVAFTGKAVSGVGNLLGGIALELIAFPSGAVPGTVPEGKIVLLGWAAGPALVGFYSLGYLFLRRYGITRERHRRIVEELERRRAPGGESARRSA